jgi:hypothetical protein
MVAPGERPCRRPGPPRRQRQPRRRSGLRRAGSRRDGFRAFVEPDLDKLLDIGVSVIPADSLIARMIAELRDLRAREPDWRKAREWLAEGYGYHNSLRRVPHDPQSRPHLLSLL